MYGFLLLVGLLSANTLACGISFLIGQTGLVLPLAGCFIVLYGLAAFQAGRGIEFRSPIAPRGMRGAASPRRNGQRPRPVEEFGSLE